MTDIIYAGKINQKVGHAIPTCQLAAYLKPKKVIGWGDKEGRHWEIMKFYEHLFPDTSFEIIDKATYVNNGYQQQEIACWSTFMDNDVEFYRPRLLSSPLINIPYVTTSFLSAAPERSLYNYIPEVSDNVLVVNLDHYKCDMLTLFTLIDNAERHIGVNSGPCWIAASCHTPITMITFPKNGVVHSDGKDTRDILTRNEQDNIIWLDMEGNHYGGD